MSNIFEVYIENKTKYLALQGGGKTGVYVPPHKRRAEMEETYRENVDTNINAYIPPHKRRGSRRTFGRSLSDLDDNEEIDTDLGNCILRDGSYFQDLCPHAGLLARCRSVRNTDQRYKLPNEDEIAEETNTCMTLDKYPNIMYILYYFHNIDALAIYQTIRAAYMYSHSIIEYNPDVKITNTVLSFYPLRKIRPTYTTYHLEHIHSHIIIGEQEDGDRILNKIRRRRNITDDIAMVIPMGRARQEMKPYTHRYYNHEIARITDKRYEGRPWIKKWNHGDFVPDEIRDYGDQIELQWNDQLESVDLLFEMIGVPVAEFNENPSRFWGTSIWIDYDDNTPTKFTAFIARDVPHDLF